MTKKELQEKLAAVQRDMSVVQTDYNNLLARYKEDTRIKTGDILEVLTTGKVSRVVNILKSLDLRTTVVVFDTEDRAMGLKNARCDLDNVLSRFRKIG